VLAASDAPSLREVGFLPIEFARSVHVAGDYAYVAHQTGMTVVDVSDPSAPRAVATRSLTGAYRVTVADGYAYVAALNNGVHILDIASPMAPQEVGIIPGAARDVFVAERIAYVIGGLVGLSLFDLTDPSAPRPLGQLPLFLDITSIFVRDGLAYMAIGQEGVTVVDVSNPAAPRQVATLDALEFAPQMYVTVRPQKTVKGRI
jgi:hypothetical protein